MGPRLAVILALQWMASLSGFAVASGSEFGVALETGFTGNKNQVLKTRSMEHGEITLINKFEAGSVGSSPEGMVDAEENLKFYFMSETEFCNLGVFAVNLFQDHDIQVGNCAGSNPADLSFNITEQVDKDLLQSLNEPQKQSRKLEMPVNKKKLYNRHKKGPKQLLRNEVQDEVKWKNVERCREYRSTKKLTTAEEIAELEKLEEMNLNLKEEEDERKERVAKMKDMYLKLIQRLQELTELISSTEVMRDIARLNSLSLPHAGDWLNVRPCPALGLHLTSAEFSISVRYRLGAPVYTTAGECPACKDHSDKEGDHAISCGSKGERIARHNHLRDHLYHTAVCSALSPTREDRAIIPGSDARPADVLIPNWTGGKDTALDVTVVNPLQTQLLSRAANKAGQALEVRFREKMTKHGEGCRLAGMAFIPMVVETFGGWEESAVAQLKKLGAALARHTGEEESEKIRHLYERLAILLVKGNAALFLNRLPNHPSPLIDGSE